MNVAPKGVFEVKQFAAVIELHQTDPGCRGNENLGILTEKWAKLG